MRRSSIWFIIAILWLIDTVIRLVRGHAHQAWLPALVTLAFVVVGFGHRHRENRRRGNEVRSRVARNPYTPPSPQPRPRRLHPGHRSPPARECPRPQSACRDVNRAASARAQTENPASSLPYRRACRERPAIWLERLAWPVPVSAPRSLSSPRTATLPAFCINACYKLFTPDGRSQRLRRLCINAVRAKQRRPEDHAPRAGLQQRSSHAPLCESRRLPGTATAWQSSRSARHCRPAASRHRDRSAAPWDKCEKRLDPIFEIVKGKL